MHKGTICVQLRMRDVILLVFSSLEFIFRFFPVFIIIYYIVSEKYRNSVLLLGSLIFYGMSEFVYVGLLLFSAVVNGELNNLHGLIYHSPGMLLLLSVAVNYSTGRWIPGKNGKRRKSVLAIGVLYNMGVLAAFKYTRFLPLPIGISFYTFQAVSYLADIYRGVITPDKKISRFATYLCMFPQLTAGPLVSYEQIRPQLS